MSLLASSKPWRGLARLVLSSRSASAPAAPYLPAMDNGQKPRELRSHWPQPDFDPKALKRLLDHDNHVSEGYSGLYGKSYVGNA